METPQTRSSGGSAPLPSGVTKLTPLEMNAIGFSKNRTVLTPEVMEKLKGNG